jgi:hypothetical protein
MRSVRSQKPGDLPDELAHDPSRYKEKVAKYEFYSPHVSVSTCPYFTQGNSEYDNAL